MLDSRLQVGICDGGYIVTADGVYETDDDGNPIPEPHVKPVCKIATSELEVLRAVEAYLYDYRAWEAREDGANAEKLEAEMSKPKRGKKS